MDFLLGVSITALILGAALLLFGKQIGASNDRTNKVHFPAFGNLQSAKILYPLGGACLLAGIVCGSIYFF